MRERKEIEEELCKFIKDSKSGIQISSHVLYTILEINLDIRELLIEKKKVVAPIGLGSVYCSLCGKNHNPLMHTYCTGDVTPPSTL